MFRCAWNTKRCSEKKHHSDNFIVVLHTKYLFSDNDYVFFLTWCKTMRVCTVHIESIGVSLFYLSNFYGIMRCHEPLDKQKRECIPYFSLFTSVFGLFCFSATVTSSPSNVSNYRKMSIDILKVEYKPFSFLLFVCLAKWPMRLWFNRIISTSYDMHENADKCQKYYRICSIFFVKMDQ